MFNKIILLLEIKDNFTHAFISGGFTVKRLCTNVKIVTRSSSVTTNTATILLSNIQVLVHIGSFLTANSITSKLVKFCVKTIDSNVEKFGYDEHLLPPNSFYCINLFIVSITQCMSSQASSNGFEFKLEIPTTSLEIEIASNHVSFLFA